MVASWVLEGWLPSNWNKKQAVKSWFAVKGPWGTKRRYVVDYIFDQIPVSFADTGGALFYVGKIFGNPKFLTQIFMSGETFTKISELWNLPLICTIVTMPTPCQQSWPESGHSHTVVVYFTNKTIWFFNLVTMYT